jgi:hypothetical protein
MVLVYGQPDDLCSCWVHESLQRRGAEVVRLQGPQDLATMGFNWSLDEGWERSFLVASGKSVPLQHLSGVLLRAHPAVRDDVESPGLDQEYIAAERRAAWVGLWNALPCRVVNRPVPGRLRRPLFAADAASLVSRCGFRLPAMRLTFDEAEAATFYRLCGREALLSSPSGQHLWQPVRGEEGAREIAAALVRHPIYLQELPDGERLQVFTVGERAFGTLADGDLLGSGEERASLPAADLPVRLQEQCCRLARSFQLDFAQLQLLRTQLGEFYCLDLSPTPDYTRCEPGLRQQITAALTTLLGGGEGKSSNDPALRRAGRPGDGVRLGASVSQR